MSFIENPFLNNQTTITHYDESEGKSVEIEQTNVAKYFTHVYLLVKKNNESIPSEFYDWQVSKEIYEQVSSKLLIHKTSVKVLKNKAHFDSIIMLSDEQLKPFNIFNYELGAKNIVIPVFNIAYQNILQYLEQYESNDTLQSIYNIKVLNKYFGVEDSNFKANEFICQIINNLEESQYWTNYYNTLINMSKKFKQRTISFQSSRMTDKNLASIVKKIFDSKVTTNAGKEDYIKELDFKSKKDNYVDVSSVIDKKGYRLYRVGAKSEFTREDINQLFSVLNEKQRFLMFANLMASKKYCHLVLNNEHILQTMKSELENFAPLFKYLMSYAWIRFYLEECIKKTFVKTTDDFIFDINTASKLPIFPFNHAKPKENPYMPLLVSDSDLKPNENLCGIQDYGTLYGPQGICNLDEFKIRMNIFCTGNPNNNLFEGFDFAKYKVGITGSLITACIQKFHPLMSRFANCDTQTEKFTNYFNEYYANSDVDVMFMTKDNFEFVENVREFHNQLILNVCKFNAPYAEPAHVKLVLNKLGYLFVNEEFINKNIQFDESLQITNKTKYVIENINDDKVKSQFLPYYKQLCIQKYNEMVKDYSDEEIVQLKKKYPDIFLLDGVDFRVYVNRNTNKFKSSDKTFKPTSSHDEENSEEQEDLNDNIEPNVETQHEPVGEIDLVFTYKYKIESPHLNHSLELFPVKYDDFFSIVARFHLPCVRGYYNGSNVYLTPSCISAHMTYMNLDYKYITGSKDPFDIINKNRMRGFGTWLNSDEKKLLVKYSREVPFWNNLYLIDSSSSENEASKNVFGPLSMNHKLFRPRLYNMDSFVNAMFVDTANRYNDSTATPMSFDNNKGMSIYTQEKFNSIPIKEINWDSFVSIDREGYIVPLKKWVIASTWDIYNSEYKKNEFKKNTTDTVSNLEKNIGEQKPSVIKKMLQKKTLFGQTNSMSSN